ncbi:MAG: NADH:ubiquinone reductase (Na(+)-transporting) subunit C [Bacteroidetes bacterium]|nr:MAG: NADH:ubiquinone reductase (Na(+)-transporting) subunit C [Bacteroidota bacterium]
MYSNKYVTIYTLVMTVIVSVLLAFLFSGLKPVHDANAEVFKKRDILKAVSDYLPTDLDKMGDKEVLQLFQEKFEQVVVDANGNEVDGVMAEDIDMAQEEKKNADQRLYPIFIYNSDKGKFYLFAVRGNGLWDKIWGTIALNEDFNTVAGASFGHVGETPGLGAEITDNPSFRNQFKGKKIFEDGRFVSVAVVKGGVKDPEHQVDAITGATITSRGVSEMLQNGLAVYLPWIEKMKQKKVG